MKTTAMASQPNIWISPDDYLEMELRSEFRNEYFDGVIYAMAGTSANHIRIVMNLGGELRNQLRGGPCEAFATELRVKRKDRRLYAYPDLVIACNELDLEKYKGLETLANPVVIFEVLSPSTERYDRRLKFDRYQAIDSLQEYVLVAQDSVYVERFRRATNGEWMYTSVNTLDGSLNLISVPASLKMSDIYERVVFPEPETHDEESQ